MKVWVYESRRQEVRVFTGDHEGWVKARAAQDEDNRVTVEEILANPDLYGGGEIDGSEEQGWWYIEDGGEINLTEVE